MIEKKSNIAFIGLGSNEGNKLENIKSAVKSIINLPDCNIEKISSVYESLPFGDIKQNNFLNAVLKISTGYEPQKLFTELKKIEVNLGRVVRQKWGPREIDLDILLFNDLIFSDEIITLPHKGIIYRDFVLVPLVEIEPEIIHPVFNKKLSGFITELQTKNIINKFSNSLFKEENYLGIK
ncbi:MAG TPA: 2-amino-4-hydroxy-6-hydroxymethyldihydropteridine diphosphokinase [Ignavibacteriaceae bacterium]